MELKAYRIYTRQDEGAWGYDPFAEPTDVELNDEQVYIKSEADSYIRKMQRTLWLARAKRARAEKWTCYGPHYERWLKVQHLCEAKAAEYNEVK